jgi:Transmembrane proteins 230/134
MYPFNCEINEHPANACSEISGLLVTGFLAALLPIEGLQSAVFFIAGAICFIPGAYHVVYIYLAVKGWQGFDFYHLPLFN